MAEETPNMQNIERDFPEGVFLIPAEKLTGCYHPPFPPGILVVITNVNPEMSRHIQELLLRIHTGDQKITIRNRMTNEFTSQSISQLDQVNQVPVDFLIPPENPGYAYEDFENIVARLRAPNGCPWDREQTHTSLRTHLLEEAYEVLEALDRNSMEDLQEELGDLLLQIVLHAQIATEGNEFRMADVLQGIYSKIVRRHPHVFGETDIKEVDGVLRNWEKLKETERKANGKETTKGILDGVPLSLPGLTRAQEIQDRAARVGFDWKTIEPVIEKMHEEIREVEQAKDAIELEKELGDLLFAAVNVIRWYKVDAESALRGANQRFLDRFKYIEDSAKKKGKNLSDLSFEEMDILWNEAKMKKIGK